MKARIQRARLGHPMELCTLLEEKERVSYAGRVTGSRVFYRLVKCDHNWLLKLTLEIVRE